MLLAATIAAAPSAHAAATMTYPANGAKVALDAGGNFTFQWTLPQGELGPTVWTGDTPNYDPDTFVPFGDTCGAPDPSQATFSCVPRPFAAGTHYAFIFTTNADNTEHYLSPVTSFVVPLAMGFGTCGPRGQCDVPPVRTTYRPHPPIGRPYSTLEVTGWLNSPGTKVSFTFTLKHGRKVVKRTHDTRSPEDTQFFFDSGVLLRHLPGVSGGTRLTCIITMSAGGITLTRTATIRAVPA